LLIVFVLFVRSRIYDDGQAEVLMDVHINSFFWRGEIMRPHGRSCLAVAFPRLAVPWILSGLTSLRPKSMPLCQRCMNHCATHTWRTTRLGYFKTRIWNVRKMYYVSQLHYYW